MLSFIYETPFHAQIRTADAGLRWRAASILQHEPRDFGFKLKALTQPIIDIDQRQSKQTPITRLQNGPSQIDFPMTISRRVWVIS